MSHSFGGVFVQRSAGVTLSAVVGVTTLADACNPYTPDMLLVSAGGASLPVRSGQSEGGRDGSAATTSGRGGAARSSVTRWESTPDTSRLSWGGSDSRATGKRALVGLTGGGADAGDAEAGGIDAGGAETGSTAAGGVELRGTLPGDAGASAGPAAEAGGAGGHGSASSGEGGLANSGAAGSGGASVNTCWLDRMRDPNEPSAGCATEQEKYWYTYLPSGSGGTVGWIEPAPSDEFIREPLSDSFDEELRAATGAAYKATIRGQISAVIDQDAGMAFKLSAGARYSVRGSTLNFYYRAQYSSGSRVLRVAIPCSTTEWSPQGTCTFTCGNHYGYELPNTNGKWTVRSVRLDTIANGGNLEQLGGGWGAYPWDPDAALSIEFDVRKYAEPFEVSVGPIWLTRPLDEGS